MKRSFRNLIRSVAISLCISFKAIAAEPVSDQEDYFQLIDAMHPPVSGVWMPFDKAQKFIYKKKLQLNDLNINILDLERQRDIALAQVTDLQQQNTQRSFLQVWGMPLGIVLGIAGSVGIFVASRR